MGNPVDPLTEENPHPVFLYSAKGKPDYANGAARILLEGRDYPPGQGSAWHQAIKTALESWRNQRIECSMRGHCFEVHFIPQFKDRRVRVYACVIPSRKKAESPNPVRNALLRNILESIPGEVFVFDSAMRVQYANRELQKHLGPPGRKKCDRYFSDRRNFYSEKRFGAVLRGKKTAWEWRFPEKKRLLRLEAMPLPTADGENWGLVIAYDHSREKQLEKKLVLSHETLSEITRGRADDLVQHKKEVERFKRLSDIGMLGAIVAHELRNPLGVIRTAVFNIQRKRTNPKIDRHLANIEKKIVESDQIINNLLFYARLKKPVIETVNPVQILKESVEAVKERFSGSRITVRMTNRLGPRPRIDADGYQMREVFLNLLNNAYQAIGDSEGSVEIILDRRGTNRFETQFRDTGCGIDREDLKKVFEPFFTRKSKGTGLGLSLCRDVIEMHGGRITIQSKKNAGTCVTVSLPARKQASSDSSAGEKPSPATPSKSAAPKRQASRRSRVRGKPPGRRDPS